MPRQVSKLTTRGLYHAIYSSEQDMKLKYKNPMKVWEKSAWVITGHVIVLLGLEQPLNWIKSNQI